MTQNQKGPSLENPDFDHLAYFKRLESLIYIMLIIPLVFFGWAFLEREKTGDLRAVFFEEPDMMFHGVMAIGVAYVLMRTVMTWKRDMRKALEDVPYLDVKLQMLRKPILFRNIMWVLGCGIGAYGIYDKGDMLYAMVFMLFMILITANRPSATYFIKLLRLKEEEKKWIQRQKNTPAE